MREQLGMRGSVVCHMLLAYLPIRFGPQSWRYVTTPILWPPWVTGHHCFFHLESFPLHIGKLFQTKWYIQFIFMLTGVYHVWLEILIYLAQWNREQPQVHICNLCTNSPCEMPPCSNTAAQRHSILQFHPNKCICCLPQCNDRSLLNRLYRKVKN